jgi:hypothetical protein
VNVGKDGTHVTVGAPGTGMSWREKVTSRGCAPVLLVTLLVIAFASL